MDRCAAVSLLFWLVNIAGIVVLSLILALFTDLFDIACAAQLIIAMKTTTEGPEGTPFEGQYLTNGDVNILLHMLMKLISLRPGWLYRRLL